MADIFDTITLEKPESKISDLKFESKKRDIFDEIDIKESKIRQGEQVSDLKKEREEARVPEGNGRDGLSGRDEYAKRDRTKKAFDERFQYKPEEVRATIDEMKAELVKLNQEAKYFENQGLSDMGLPIVNAFGQQDKTEDMPGMLQAPIWNKGQEIQERAKKWDDLHNKIGQWERYLVEYEKNLPMIQRMVKDEPEQFEWKTAGEIESNEERLREWREKEIEKKGGYVGVGEELVHRLKKPLDMLPFSPSELIRMDDIKRAAERWKLGKYVEDDYGLNTAEPELVHYGNANYQRIMDYGKKGIINTRYHDKKILEDFIKEMEFQERPKNIGAKFAGGLLDMMPWMAEFYLTSGLMGAGAKTAEKAAETGVRAALRKGLEGIAGAGARTALMQHRIGEGYVRRTTPDIGKTEEGELYVGDIKKNTSKDALYAVLGTYTEVLSEQSGEAITKLASKLPLLGRVIQGISKITGNNADDVGEALAKGGFSDLFGEWGEERFGTVLHAIIGDEDFGLKPDATWRERLSTGLKQDMKEIVPELMVLGAIPAGGRVVKAGINYKGKRRLQKGNARIKDLYLPEDTETGAEEIEEFTTREEKEDLKFKISDLKEKKAGTEITEKKAGKLTGSMGTGKEEIARLMEERDDRGGEEPEKKEDLKSDMADKSEISDLREEKGEGLTTKGTKEEEKSLRYKEALENLHDLDTKDKAALVLEMTSKPLGSIKGRDWLLLKSLGGDENLDEAGPEYRYLASARAINEQRVQHGNDAVSAEKLGFGDLGVLNGLELGTKGEKDLKSKISDLKEKEEGKGGEVEESLPVSQEGEVPVKKVGEGKGEAVVEGKWVSVEPVEGLERMPIVKVNPKGLRRHPDLPNWKLKADKTTGIVPGEELGPYKDFPAKPIVIWVKNDGTQWIVTGSHRAYSGVQYGQDVWAQFVYEKDGFTKEDAFSLDAEDNIRDNKGEVIDYVTYYEYKKGLTREDAEKGGLLAGVKAKQGWAIAREASNDLRALFKAGEISATKAAVIASAAPGNAGIQREGIKKRDSMNAEQLENFVKAIVRNGPTRKAIQGDLLEGFEDYTEYAEKFSAAQTKKIRETRSKILAIEGALRHPIEAGEMGLKFMRKQDQMKAELKQLYLEVEEWKNPDSAKVAEIEKMAGITKPKKSWETEEEEGLTTKDTKEHEGEEIQKPMSDAEYERRQGSMFAVSDEERAAEKKRREAFESGSGAIKEGEIGPLRREELGAPAVKGEGVQGDIFGGFKTEKKSEDLFAGKEEKKGKEGKKKLTAYRMGDYYEFFGEDAKILSQKHGVALVKSKTYDTEMAGVPYHSSYVMKENLEKLGYDIEWIEKPTKEQLESIKKKDLTEKPKTEPEIGGRKKLSFAEWLKNNPEPERPEKYGNRMPLKTKEYDEPEYKNWVEEHKKWMLERKNIWDISKEKIEEESKKPKREGIEEDRNILKWALKNAPENKKYDVKEALDDIERADIGEDRLLAAWQIGAVNYADKLITKAGGKKIYESDSGSVYYEMPDGYKIRISDHEVPTGRMSEEKRMGGSDEEIIFDRITGELGIEYKIDIATKEHKKAVEQPGGFALGSKEGGQVRSLKHAGNATASGESTITEKGSQGEILEIKEKTAGGKDLPKADIAALIKKHGKTTKIAGDLKLGDRYQDAEDGKVYVIKKIEGNKIVAQDHETKIWEKGDRIHIIGKLNEERLTAWGTLPYREEGKDMWGREEKGESKISDLKSQKEEKKLATEGAESAELEKQQRLQDAGLKAAKLSRGQRARMEKKIEALPGAPEKAERAQKQSAKKTELKSLRKQVERLENVYGLEENTKSKYRRKITAGRTDKIGEMNADERKEYVEMLQKTDHKKPETQRILEELKPLDAKDPVLKEFIAEIDGKKGSVETIGKPVKVGDIMDVDIALADAEMKTGLPVFQKDAIIKREGRDIKFEVNKEVEKGFKTAGLKPNEVKFNVPVEERIFNFLASGNRPQAMTDKEARLGQYMKESYYKVRWINKIIRHRRYMTTGELPPDINHEGGRRLMEEGAAIFKKGDDEAYKRWIDSVDFGVREHYVPTHRKINDNLDRLERRWFGRGFTKTREAEEIKYDPEHSLIEDWYKYLMRAHRIWRLEPHLSDMEALFNESEGKLKPGLMKSYLDNYYNVYREYGTIGKGGIWSVRQLYRTLIPQKIVNWIRRNLFQTEAITLPKVTKITDPIFWKNSWKLLRTPGISLWSASREKLFKKRPELKEHFYRYVTSLDMARKHYMFMEQGEFSEKSLRNVMFLMDAITKYYGFSDDVNRAKTFVYAYDAGMDAIERYKKEPTKKNLYKIFDVTGTVNAPTPELQEFARMLDRGDEHEAAALLATRLANSTQFRYPAEERGLEFQTEYGKLLLPIATYAKGNLQNVWRDMVKPVIDYGKAKKAGKATEFDRHRAFRGLMHLLHWMLASQIVNRLYEKIYGVDKGQYGWNTLVYVPGGPFIRQWTEMGDVLLRGMSGEKGAGAKFMYLVDKSGDIWLPFYKMLENIGAYRGKTEEGTHKFRYDTGFMRQIQKAFRMKLAKMRGDENPRDTRKWIELTGAEIAQKVILSGAWSPKKDAILNKYKEYLDEQDYGRSLEIKKQLEKMLRKYPVSTKRVDEPRTLENIENIVPGIKKEVEE